LRLAEILIEIGVMKLPRGVDFSAEERKVFHELNRALPDLLNTDFYVIELFCRNLCRWRRLVIEERNLVDAGADSYKVSIMLAGAWKGVESAITKLSLSPADRKKGIGGSGTPGKVLKDNPLMKMLSERN